MVLRSRLCEDNHNKAQTFFPKGVLDKHNIIAQILS